MNNSISILALARNSKSALEATVESVRNFVDAENVNLIVVDNASEDGLSEWAKTQEDLSYVYMDQGFEPWGSVLNQVIKAFEIEDLAMILAPGMILTPSGIKSMCDALKSAGHPLAAVAAVNNTARSHMAAPETRYQTYPDALEYAKSHENDMLKQAMEVEQYCTMFTLSAYNTVGGFQDDLKTLTGVFNDFSRKLLLSGFHMGVCRNTITFNAIGHVMPEEAEYGEEDRIILRKLWGSSYFGLNGNYNLVSKIHADNKAEITVLEIGCDCGATLFDIKQIYPHAKIIGCDINENALKVAACVCDQVFTSNIDTDDLPLPENSVDYIIFGDVLEHLRDPEAVLIKIQKNLKANGHVIASIPNLMNISVIKQLLHGDFTYADMGLLDRTHIHFFTYNEMLRMFFRAGYQPKDVSSVLINLTDTDEKIIDTLLSLDQTPEKFMYQAFQYVIDAVRK